MAIAVTAASGQLGTSILRALGSRQTGRPIVALARAPGKIPLDQVEKRPGDYTDRAGLARFLAGVDTMILISLNTPPSVRTEQHRIALAAAADAGVRRILYTSVQGAEDGTSFSAVIQSNRQTEADLSDRGFEGTVGRNGIYIEPDVDDIDSYAQAGEITNCAGDGLCGYTTRSELAAAYATMALGVGHTGQIYNLHGPPLTQKQLAEYLSRTFGVTLAYRPMTPEAYLADRRAVLGTEMGTIIAGIYDGIRRGAFDAPSDFEAAAGRPYQSWDAYFASVQAEKNERRRFGR